MTKFSFGFLLVSRDKLSMKLLASKWLLICFFVLFAFNAAAEMTVVENVTAEIATVEIEMVEDLRVLKQQADSADLPILLMFTAEDCEYCDALRDNYLLPMIKSGDYDASILIKQVDIDEYSYLRNAKGELVGGDSLAMHYDVEVTPTILFLNSSGHELTKRLVGISNIYYFGGTLDKHISQAKTAYDKLN